MVYRLVGAKPLSEPNAGILLIEHLRTNFSEISNIFIQENAFQSVVCEMAAILSQLNVLTFWWWDPNIPKE